MLAESHLYNKMFAAALKVTLALDFNKFLRCHTDNKLYKQNQVTQSSVFLILQKCYKCIINHHSYFNVDNLIQDSKEQNVHFNEKRYRVQCLANEKM